MQWLPAFFRIPKLKAKFADGFSSVAWNEAIPAMVTSLLSYSEIYGKIR
jgi:hypothetical protein